MKSAPSLTSTSHFSVLPNDQYVPPVFHTVSGTSKYDHIIFDIQLFGKYRKADLKAMLDCGASTIFIHPRLVKEKNITTRCWSLWLCCVDGLGLHAGLLLIM